MHIAHLILTRRFAGSERYAVELAAAQAAAGHQVTVVLRKGGAEARSDAIAHRLPAAVRKIVVPDVWSAWHARRHLRRLLPDVAHAHLSAGCKALRGLKGCMVRVATLHIHYKARQHAHLDGLVMIAPWQRVDIPASQIDRAVHIDNWTQRVERNPAVAQKLRSMHGISPDCFLIGALGRVEPGKGLDLLVKAFREARIPGARLAIVGHGSASADIRRAATADVLMPGFTENPQAWLAAFDSFVSPARSEPFGLVLLEAMEAGLPILATATQGARHLAPTFGTPLVPLDDSEALAEGLRCLVEGGRVRRHYNLENFRLEGKLELFDAFYRRSARVADIDLPT